MGPLSGVLTKLPLLQTGYANLEIHASNSKFA